MFFIILVMFSLFFFFWINIYNGVGGEERRFKLWMSLLKILEGAS